MVKHLWEVDLDEMLSNYSVKEQAEFFDELLSFSQDIGATHMTRYEDGTRVVLTVAGSFYNAHPDFIMGKGMWADIDERAYKAGCAYVIWKKKS
jgi:hypothetical protein